MAKKRRTAKQTKPKQMGLALQQKYEWGGAREGAGRKRIPEGKRRVDHAQRPVLRRNQPAHVTWRVLPHVWNLRSVRGFKVLLAAFVPAAERFGVRITHFSAQGNHLHVVAEGAEGPELARAMKALAIRVAKGINRLMGHKGAVFADRYYARPLRSPAEVRNVVRYVMNNANVHAERAGRPTSTHADRYAIGPGVNQGPRAWWRKFFGQADPVREPCGYLLNRALETA
jgi:putative transposase